MRQLGELSLSDIPNQAGYEFIGIRRDGTAVPCTVICDDTTHLHSIKQVTITELRGWRYLPAKS